MPGRLCARLVVSAAALATGLVPAGTAFALSPATTSTTVKLGGPPVSAPPTTLPTGSSTTTTIPPPPAAMPTFALPTNSGLQLLQTMQQAKDDLQGASRGVGPARHAIAVAVRHETAVRRDLKALEAVARRTEQALADTRDVLRRTAVQAYMNAGSTQLGAAIASVMDATSVVDASSQLHVLGTFGTEEKHVLDEYVGLRAQVAGQLAHIREVSARASNAVRDARRHLAALQRTMDDARLRMAVTLAGMHDFETAATSATSPILGPSSLTAKQMADFVAAQHYTPHLTVPVEVLAQLYLDEGARTGVRGDVAFAQSILETGGFANPGSAPTDNNFAGIGWCDTCAHGFDFPDADTGVRAQLQLLRIYVDPLFPADDPAYKDPILLPGTLSLGFRGRVQTWWDLWGTWATGDLYGQRVYDIYERMVLFAATDPTAPVKTAAARPAAPAPPGARAPARPRP